MPVSPAFSRARFCSNSSYALGEQKTFSARMDLFNGNAVTDIGLAGGLATVLIGEIPLTVPLPDPIAFGGVLPEAERFW